MLVGMDLLWQLQTGHSKRGTTEEPVAIETIFGWTLAGKIGGSNGSDMKVNVNLFIEEGGKNGIENNLKSFGITKHWELEKQIMCMKIWSTAFVSLVKKILCETPLANR